MRGHPPEPSPSGDTEVGRAAPGVPGRLLTLVTGGMAVALGVLSAVAVTTGSASAADNPYQRGPDPTRASVAAVTGPFATASVSVPSGYGFAGGAIYYPTDTSQGTFGAVAISPGYTALFSTELAWMGPWLASHGIVVIGIETNSRNDFDVARGTQLLAALDYLTQQSPVRDRVDHNRLAVSGHSMGGGGALNAAIRRPSLKAAVGIAPYLPSSNLANDRVPTMVLAGQADTVVTPTYLNGLHGSLPAATENAYLEIAGADHLFPVGRSNAVMIRTMLPFLKMFVDNDARYSQFLCPLLDSTGVVTYRSTCPLLPPTTPPTGTPSPDPSDTPTPPPSSTAPPVAGCSANYRTTNSWPGGYQGEITVTTGNSAINGWTVRWTLSSGQTVSQVWNGTLSTSGSTVSVRNASYNGSLPPAGFTTFGFLGSGTPSPPSLTCTSP
ncbi:poly(ethylene terephthalate) hydrolase family protein [Plantactinospora sonchi]|uniref:Cellulose binding domain-containing protein n=1 Tax=Plantactinospora sonchi TaxID=1544735 RepID=A0ABU7RZ91_9ACTN